ncbi:Plant galacturonosyltransferase GAUT protein [Dioscorea alata]|uniref:Plant galacturonosyltransferase GAUT protein n=1 Tax=Dioscorea alata TaxID=55571 RepID=A0ACB7TSS4_DIOAL|nr:Plant galacturonosyltransferase GAUT protein [Dioscorea alata]
MPMKSKDKVGRRFSSRSVLPLFLAVGLILLLLFICFSYFVLEAGASICLSIGCLRWRIGHTFLGSGDPSEELVRELRKAFVGDEDGKDGPSLNQMALDAAAESLDALIAEMAISTSDYNQHIDVKTFAHKAMAMIMNMDRKVKKARLQGLIYQQLASIGIPVSMHCLTLLLVDEYTANSLARSSLPPPEYSSRLTDDSYIHIALLTNNVLAAAVVVSSTLASSSSQENLVFHIVTDKNTYTAMHTWFSLNPVFPAIIEVKGLHQFDWPAHVNALVMETVQEIHHSSLVHHQLSRVNEEFGRLQTLNPSAFSLLNYLRIHLPELFPKLRRVIFLDDDVVVRQDLTELWNSDLNGNVNGAVTAAVVNDKGYQQCLGKQYQDYLNFSNPIISSPLLGLESQKCAWLGGMNVFDLEAWRQTDITKTYQHWLKLNRESGFHLWRMGAQPPALMAFGGQVQLIDPSWHLSGLGRRLPDPELLESSSVLHYSGPRKPWLGTGIPELQVFWRTYLNHSNDFLSNCKVME